MLGVKITALLIVITVIWTFLFKIECSNNPITALAIQQTKKFPWWWKGLAICYLLDLIGIFYTAVYVIFFVWR